MRKKIIITIVSIFFIFLSCGVIFLHLKASSLHLKNKNIKIAKNLSKQLNYSSKLKVHWSSDDPKVADVTDSGVLKTCKVGKIKIYARCLWYYQSCTVTVTDPSISEEEMTVCIGEEKTLTITGTKSDISWENTNPEVISFENGNVTPLSPGTSIIKAKVDGLLLQTKVVVPAPKLVAPNVTKGQRGHAELQNYAGSDIKWTMSPQEIISLSIDGKEAEITGLNVGKATIKVAYGDKEVQSDVCVDGDQGLEIVGNDIKVGETEKLTIKNLVGCYTVKWKGVKGSKKGTANFTKNERGDYEIKAIVNTGNGDVELKKTIKVYKKEPNITKWEGKVGEEFEFTMIDGKNIKYEFDDKYLSNNEGKFKALKSGNTQIVVKDDDTEFTCDVTIEEVKEEKDEEKEESQEDNEKNDDNENTEDEKEEAQTMAVGSGGEVINYAMNFLGNPYVYGGSSLTNGTDCSGFVMRIYEHFGISLPHSSASQRSCGQSVGSLNDAVAGDILCYSGHVALYMGDGRIIHASTPKTGICIGNNPQYRKILDIRRLL